MPPRDTSQTDAAVLSKRFDQNPGVLAAYLHTASPDQRASLLANAAAATRNREPLPDLDLLELAADPGLCPTAADRDAFLLAHAGHVALLRAADPTDALVVRYLGDLKAAAMDPAVWKAVRDDPAGLLLRAAVPNLPAEDLAFYETHKDWLAEVLAAISADPADPVATPAAVVAEVLAACRTYHPLPMRAAAPFGPDGVVPFLIAGDAVRVAHGQGVPLADLVEVVYAQADAVGGDPHAAATLVALFQKEKELWAAAKETPRLLWLYKRLPARAAAVVKLFPHDGVPALLAESYADTLEPACEALERDPQAALAVLHRAAADPTSLPGFKASLNAHGWRVVPYAAAFGVPEAGRVTPAWLDKAFDAAGRPRGKEWWTQIPLVGGPADLVRSVKNGTVEAGEVGWAALDVVDGVLLVASVGGTSGLTAAKQAAKAGARQGLKSAARAGVGKAALAGVRTATRPSGSLLARVAGRTAVVAGRAGKFVIKPSSRTAATAVRALRRGVASLTPVQSKLLARGLLAVGLGVTLQYRTFPALAAWYERQVADGVHVLEAAYAAAQKLIDALNGEAAVGTGVLDAPAVGFTWLCRGVVAAAAAYGWWRLTRRRCRN